MTAQESNCPICQRSDSHLYGEKNGYTVLVCRGCSHRFVKLEGTHEVTEDAEAFRRHMTNNLMDSDEAYYQHLCASELAGGHAWHTAKLILGDWRCRAVGPSTSWLDIGSGSGFLVAQARRLGLRAVGVEPGYWGQLAARDKGIEIIHGVLTEHTFTDLFDVVSATDVLEHQQRPKEFLLLLKRRLKPEGLVYLSFPYGGCLRARVLRMRWNMVQPPTHCQFFTRNSFRMLADTTGLNVVCWKVFNTGGLPGLGRFGINLNVVNRAANLLGLGDQMLVVLRSRD